MKRKERDTLIKTNPDLSKPFDFTKIGTEDDCFGKLWDPSTDECSICGDCELCAIKQSQTNRKKRAELEEAKVFKDIQKITITRRELAVFVKAQLKKLGELPIPKLKALAVKELRIDEALFDKVIKKVIEKSSYIKPGKNPNTLTYKK